MSCRDGRRVPKNRENGNLHHPVNLMRVANALSQLRDSAERFLSDIITFKSQVTSDCETDPQVLDWVQRHHYLRLAISNLKNAEMERAFSFIVIACNICFAHVNLHTRPLVVTVDTSEKNIHIVYICRHERRDICQS